MCIATSVFLCLILCFFNSPGRFFTVVVMKVMMTHVLMNYDIKLREGEHPVESWFVTENLANGSAAVLFRKRKEKFG